MTRALALMALAMLLSGCAQTSAVTGSVTSVEAGPPVTGWAAALSAEDRARLAGLPETWRKALQAVPLRLRRQVEREGPLLVADAARSQPALPPGSYRCRLVKLGVPAAREPAVQSFPDFFCYIRGESDGRLSFTKQTGTELPGGWLHEDGPRRLVLTGARQRAVGDNSLAYGAEPERDLVGVVERIGPFRWRLVLPWREARAGLDVYELTPVPPEQQVDEPVK